MTCTSVAAAADDDDDGPTRRVLLPLPPPPLPLPLFILPLPASPPQPLHVSCGPSQAHALLLPPLPLISAAICTAASATSALLLFIRFSAARAAASFAVSAPPPLPPPLPPLLPLPLPPPPPSFCPDASRFCAALAFASRIECCSKFTSIAFMPATCVRVVAKCMHDV